MQKGMIINTMMIIIFIVVIIMMMMMMGRRRGMMAEGGVYARRVKGLVDISLALHTLW